MTKPHIGKEIDSFNFRELLRSYDFSDEFLANSQIEVLLDAVVIEALTLMRERNYIDEKYIFGSKGNGEISVRDTTLADHLPSD